MNTNESTLVRPTRSLDWCNAAAWAAQVLAAVILAQTLYFKFQAAPESVYIFESLGVEPWGRIAAGVAELFAAAFLLVPRLNWLGAALGFGVILGALGTHLFVIGIEVQGDGGLLFALAVVVLSCCAATLYLRRGAWLRLMVK